jgi:hypothetical protein
MIVFTPNTVIKSADVNLNFSELKTKTDYLSTPDNGWIAPTLLNSWINYGSGYNDAGYRINALGEVHLKGLIKNGTTTIGTNIFLLPTGYRPAQTYIFSASANDLWAEIRVQTTGYVTTGAGVSASWTCLDGLIFKVA